MLHLFGARLAVFAETILGKNLYKFDKYMV